MNRDVIGVVGSLASLVAVWWVIALTVSPGMPTPAAVFAAGIDQIQRPSFAASAGVSAIRVYIPFGIAVAIGVPIGVLAGWYDPLADLVMPAFELLRPIPPIAWIPAVILLLPGTEAGIMFITFLGAFFPILLNSLEGGRQLDGEYVKAAHSLGAGRFSVVRHVVLPGAMPAISRGLYVGMGLAWINLVAAEMIAGGSGLGYLTWSAYTGGSYAYIVVGMLSIAALGTLSTMAVRHLDTVLLPWAVEREGVGAVSPT